MVTLLKQTGHTRLYRRGAYYYHRAMVPTDIKEAYKLAYGKAEETFSLKTANRAEALRLVKIAAVQVDQKFVELRNRVRPSAVSPVEALTKEQTERVKDSYFALLLGEDEMIRDVGFDELDDAGYCQIDFAETIAQRSTAAQGSLGFLLHPHQTAHLMGTPKFDGGDTPIMAEMGRLMGYAAPDSAQTLAGDIWFGNWADLVIASWGGLDILVDPYTESTSGAVRVTAFQDTDVICRHEQSFVRGRFGGDE